MSGYVSPDYIGLIRLEIPRRYQDQVVISDPHSALDFSSYPTGPDLAVGALYNDVVATDQFYDSAKKLTLTGHHHLF
jgi:hypothetical protein